MTSAVAAPLMLIGLFGCGPQCAEETPVFVQTWTIDAWERGDDLPSEPDPPSPHVDAVFDAMALEDVAAGAPRENTILRAGASRARCGPAGTSLPCYVYEIFWIIEGTVSAPSTHTTASTSADGVGIFLTLFSRDGEITEPDPGRSGGRYFDQVPGTGTVWVDEFGPDVKLRYDVTFDNGEGRIRHVVGSLETERSVQCVAD